MLNPSVLKIVEPFISAKRLGKSPGLLLFKNGSGAGEPVKTVSRRLSVREPKLGRLVRGTTFANA